MDCRNCFQHPKTVIKSGIPENSSRVERTAHSNSKSNSQLPVISPTQLYLKERWEGKYGHQLKATYSGAAAGGLTLKKQHRNIRYRLYSKLSSSQCGLTSGPKWYRIIERFALEGTVRGHLAQTPCSEQGRLQLDEVAQSPVQPGLECLQGWGTYHLCGQPVPVFHHPHRKKFLPYFQSKSTLPPLV